MAQEWIKMADDGDHYRLTFDQSGTWSQKYNLVWDKLLDLGIFPKDVMDKEIAYYLTKQMNTDYRSITAEHILKQIGSCGQLQQRMTQQRLRSLLIQSMVFVTETPDRVPMSDWYETTDAKQVGFQARSVVGGYFIKLLE